MAPPLSSPHHGARRSLICPRTSTYTVFVTWWHRISASTTTCTYCVHTLIAISLGKRERKCGERRTTDQPAGSPFFPGRTPIGTGAPCSKFCAPSTSATPAVSDTHVGVFFAAPASGGRAIFQPGLPPHVGRDMMSKLPFPFARFGRALLSTRCAQTGTGHGFGETHGVLPSPPRLLLFSLTSEAWEGCMYPQGIQLHAEMANPAGPWAASASTGHIHHMLQVKSPLFPSLRRNPPADLKTPGP